MVLAVTACGKKSGPVASAAAPAPKPPTGAAPWPAPKNALALTKEAGLEAERKETLTFHVHAHLDVFVNGRKVVVPGGIGINIADPGVKSGKGPSYGGISMCDEPCISPLHTHDPSGIIHTEAKTATPNRLGEFFVEWDVRLDRSCVGGYCKPDASIQIFVDGMRFTGDPRRIQLTDKKEIAIVIGSPPKKIPSSIEEGTSS